MHSNKHVIFALLACYLYISKVTLCFTNVFFAHLPNTFDATCSITMGFETHLCLHDYYSQYISNHFTNVSVKSYTIISAKLERHWVKINLQFYTDDGISFYRNVCEMITNILVIISFI